MDLRAMLKRKERKNLLVAPMINDEEDFKSTKKGVASKGHASSAPTMKKRVKRQVLKDSDSEEETAPSKKLKAAPVASAKSKAPGKSPASSKTLKSKSSPMTSKAKKRTDATISDFFGSSAIMRTHREAKTDTSSQLPQTKDSGVRRSSHTSSEVNVIPESPAPAGESPGFEGEVAMAFLQEEEMEKSRLEEQMVHEDKDFGKTLSAADEGEPGHLNGKKQGPTKKLKLLVDKVVDLPSPTKVVPTQTTPTKRTSRTTSSGSTLSTPTKKATPIKIALLSQTTPSKQLPAKATPTKGTAPKGTRCSPRLMKMQASSQQSPSKAPIGSQLSRKAKRTIHYVDVEEDNGEKQPEKIPKREPALDSRKQFKGKPSLSSNRRPATKSRKSSSPVAKQTSSSPKPVSHVSESPPSTPPPVPVVPFTATPLVTTPPSKAQSELPAGAPSSPSQQATPIPRFVPTSQQDSSSSITPSQPIPLALKPHPTTPSMPPQQVSQRSITPDRPVLSPSPPRSEARRSTTPSGSLQPKNRENYIKYLNRSGPKNLGSKAIPEGAANCLEGLTFVITGVLDSMERETAADLVKQYGGKVTGNVSGRTNYLVVGEEAGEGKLAKAEKFGTQKIDEDGLLELIRTRLPPKGGQGKTKGGKRGKKKSSATEEGVGVVKGACSRVDASAPRLSPPAMTKDPSPTSVPAASPVVSRSREKRSPECLLWVDKYRPQDTKKIIGQQGPKSNAKKLSQWLQNWAANHASGNSRAKGSKDNDGSGFKAALLSGPPGIGKTTTAQLVCKENGFSYVETNASSCRNKSAIQGQVSSQLSSRSITAFLGSSKGGMATGQKHVLIMDEVDGMDGNADRGGIGELISLIKTSSIPIICICNDRQKKNIRSLANHCFDLSFQRPNIKQIVAAVRSICFKEGITIDTQALTEIVMASGQDMRQVLHNLSLWSASDEPDGGLKADVAMEAARNAKKHLKMNPFEVVRTVFNPREGDREFTLLEKSDLFFHDYSLSSLFVQENYPRAHPTSARGSVWRHLRCAASAADSLAQGDIVERILRKDSHWELLPLQAFLSSVIPGEHMKGFLGRPVFPQWLGNFSKTNRCDRLLQDMQRHTRLTASCNKTEFGMDYLPLITTKLTQPLVTKGAEGVPEVVEVMNEYDLQREDMDSLSELAQYSGHPGAMSQIPAQVKATLTRTLNKSGHLSHYASTATAKKRTRSMEEGEGEEEEEGAESEDEGLEKNPMIKPMRKPSAGKGKGKMGHPESKKKGPKK